MEQIDLFIMAFVYSFAGIMHFVLPSAFTKIVPRYLPARKILVYISGFFEILFGVGLLFETTRSWSAIGLIGLLIAVFPANIYMAQRFKEKGNKYTWAAYARLPLQLLLIYWAYIYV